MNRLRVIQFFFLFSFSFLYPLSPEQLKQNYSLMVKVRDPLKGLRWALISCEQFLDKEQVFITQNSFRYNKDDWAELAAMWEVVEKPEDVGCYPLQNQFVDLDNGKAVCLAHIENRDTPLTLTFNINFDKNLQFNEAFLLINDFVQECTFRHKEQEQVKKVQKDGAFDHIDIEFEDEEVASYQESAPSQLIVYARQIGVGLLMRYLALKNYVVDTWISLKIKFLHNAQTV